MPGPGATEVGRVSIRVLPDSDGFRNRLRGQLASETAGLEAKIKIEPDFDLFRQRIQAELARVSQMKAKVDIGFNLDTEYLRGQLTYIVRKAARGIEAHIRVRWVPSVAVLRAELEALVRAAEAGIDVNIPVRFNQKGGIGGGFGGLLTNPGVIIGALAAIQPAIQMAYGLYTAIQNLLPLLLAVPGAIFSIGAVGATAALGLKGFFDAFDEKKGAAAFKKLAPNAKEAVTELKKFGAEYKALQQLVQNELFEGMAKPMGQVAKEYLPILRNGLRLIAGQLNLIGKGFLTALVLPTSKNSVASILESTRRAMIGMGPATSNVTQALLRLGAFGAKQFEKIGLAADRAAARFALWVDNGVSTGRFQAMFDKAIQTAKDFWAVLKNIASIIGIVVKGMNQGFDNQSWLGNLKESTQQLKEFLQTAEAQEGLKGLGQTLDAISRAVKDVFLAAMKELAPIMRDLGPVIQGFAKGFSDGFIDGIKIAGDILRPFAALLRENKDLIEALARPLGLFAAALLAVKIAKGIISKLQQFGSAVRGLGWLGKAGLWIGLFELAQGINEVNVKNAGGDPEKLGDMAQTLNDLIEAAKQIASGDFGAILDDIALEWQQFKDNWNSGDSEKSPVGAWFQKVKDSFYNDLIVPMEQVGTKVNEFIGFVIGKMNEFGTFINTKIGEFIQWVTTIPTRTGEGLSGWATVTYQAALNAFGELARGAADKFNEFTVWLAGLPGRIVSFFTGLPGMLSASASASFGGFQGGATGKVGEILGWIAGLPGRMLAALGNLGSLLVQAGRNLMSGLLGGIVAGLAPIISYVSRIAAWIRSVKGPESYDKKVLRDPGLWMMQGFHGGLKDGFGVILKDVSGYADQIAGQFQEPIDVKVKGNIPNMANGSYTADLAHSVTADGFGIDYERLATAMESRPVELQADGRSIATIVNKSNTRKNRR